MTYTTVILRGASGSGKSTFIKNNLSDGLVCSADHFFMQEDGSYQFDATKLFQAHNQCYKKFQEAVENNIKLVVVDNTNTTVKEFEKYVLFAKQKNYNIRIVRMEVPLEVLYGRNVHNVPNEVVKKMYDRMEDIPKFWNIQELNAKGY